MISLDAILVDFDGTLVDSEYAGACAYSKAIAHSGLRCLPDDIRARANGRHWSEFLPELVGAGYSPELGAKIAEEKRRIYPDYFSLIRINRGLVGLLQAVRGRVPSALVTNASRASVVEILLHHGLVDLFDLLICQEDVQNPKPHPEGYLLALSRLHGEGANSLAIEDSETGVRAAEAANIPVWRIISFD